MNAVNPPSVLQVSEEGQVLDPIRERLDVTEHHRRRRPESEPVRRLHDLEPFPCGALVGREPATHLVDQDLRAAARDGIEARTSQPLDRLPERQARGLPDVHDLGGRERVQPEPRKPPLEVSEEPLVVVDPDSGL